MCIYHIYCLYKNPTNTQFSTLYIKTLIAFILYQQQNNTAYWREIVITANFCILHYIYINEIRLIWNVQWFLYFVYKFVQTYNTIYGLYWLYISDCPIKNDYIVYVLHTIGNHWYTGQNGLKMWYRYRCILYNYYIWIKYVYSMMYKLYIKRIIFEMGYMQNVCGSIASLFLYFHHSQWESDGWKEIIWSSLFCIYVLLNFYRWTLILTRNKYFYETYL